MAKKVYNVGDSGNKWEKMYGRQDRSLDAKNRVVIPSQFREELGDVFYITYGLHAVLEIRSKDEFLKFSHKFQNVNELDADLKKLWRILSMRTAELTVDKSGRVIIPKNLLDLATIKKDLSFVGMGNVCEVWAQEALDKTTEQIEQSSEIEKLVEKISKKGVVL
ncbi:hypothetical protein ACW95P_01385 [Candidatus Mycoplasma pogonae]